MKTTTNTAGPRRSRLSRTVAVALGVLTVASLGLVGTPGASAAPAGRDLAAAPAAGTVDHAESAQVRRFCLVVEGVRGARSGRCGDNVMVGVPGAIQSVRLGARDSLCVAVRGIRGDRDRECERRGGFVEASVRGVVSEVGLFIDDTRLCGRARSNFRWGRTQCSGRGALELEARGRGGIDGLHVWVGRRW